MNPAVIQRTQSRTRSVYVPSVLSPLSNDVDMEVDHFTNGVTESSSNGFLNGTSKHVAEPDDCDADMGGSTVCLKMSIFLFKRVKMRVIIIITISFSMCSVKTHPNIQPTLKMAMNCLQRWSPLSPRGSCAAGARRPLREWSISAGSSRVWANTSAGSVARTLPTRRCWRYGRYPTLCGWI